MARQVSVFIAFSLICLTQSVSGSQRDCKIKNPKSVCFENLGCFCTNCTFRCLLDLLPDSPDQIGTTFSLFTKHNPEAGQDLHYDEPDTLQTTLFDPTLATVILIHGFDVTSDPRDWFLKKAFLSHTSSQVIVVDWRKGAKSPIYWQAVVNAEVVGRQVAFLVKKLNEKRNLQPDKVHILGSSLGAHAAGFAGKWFRDQYNLLIGRISGNDAAGPYFEDASETVHLSSKDARFVDVIHTNGGRDMLNGQAGMWKAIGQVDFYPNGGVYQPGCEKGHPTCSHMRADDLYAESLSSRECRFKSFPCTEGYQDFQKGMCTDCGKTGCSELGFHAINSTGRGSQYLSTNAERPFCKP